MPLRRASPPRRLLAQVACAASKRAPEICSRLSLSLEQDSVTAIPLSKGNAKLSCVLFVAWVATDCGTQTCAFIHCLILLQKWLTFQQVLQIALERFWQGARHPLHLLPVVISGMEHPKAQVLNGAVGMTPPGSSVVLLMISCSLFVSVCISPLPSIKSVCRVCSSRWRACRRLQSLHSHAHQFQGLKILLSRWALCNADQMHSTI